jgi:hypothetical protein
MSRRMYFLLPDVEAGEKIVQELLISRIEEKRLHFLGRRDTDMKSLPEATPIHKTGLIRGLYIGLISGSVTGLLAGLYLYYHPELIGMQAPPYVIFVCAFVGAIIGAWISGPLIGGSSPNTKLIPFQESLNNGKILLILDAPHKRTDELRELIRSHYPESV